MAGVRTGAGGAIMVTKPRLELRRRLVQRFRPQVRGQLALFGQHRSRSISSDVRLSQPMVFLVCSAWSCAWVTRAAALLTRSPA